MGFHFAHKALTAEPGRLAEKVAAGGPFLVEFAERDAPACRLQEPILSKVLRRYVDRLSVVQADVDSSPEDATAFGITAVPTFVLFVDGAEKMRLVGYQTIEELNRAIDEVLPAAAVPSPQPPAG